MMVDQQTATTPGSRASGPIHMDPPVAAVYSDEDYDDPLQEGGEGPWPYLKRYVKYVRQNPGQNGYMFQCMYCLPKENIFAVSSTTKFNIRRHYSRVHIDACSDLERAIQSRKPQARRTLHRFHPPPPGPRVPRGAVVAEDWSDYTHNNEEYVQLLLSREQIQSEDSEREPTPPLPTPGVQVAEDQRDYSHNNEDNIQMPLSHKQVKSEENERELIPVLPTPPKPESYQLHHNNHLNIVLESLAQDELFMDVTLTAQGRSLKAHKSVLSAVSPYFRGVLQKNPCQHPIIIMPRDVRFEELYSIVNYIYKGEVTVTTEDLASLLKTAEILEVSGLAPSDSTGTCTINPTIGRNIQSSGSSSLSPSTHPTGSRGGRAKRSRTEPPTPPVRPVENVVIPSDFMDLDMTCIKEEMPVEWEGDELITNEASTQPSKSMLPDPNADSPTTSTSVMKDQMSLDSIIGLTEPSGPIRTADPTREDPVPFTCPHCYNVHRSLDLLTSHLQLKHPSKPSFPCGCGRVFVRQLQHQAHARLCNKLS